MSEEQHDGPNARLDAVEESAVWLELNGAPAVGLGAEP